MIRILRYEGQPVEELLNRASAPQRDVTDAVTAILEDVRLRGDAAALDACERFDGVRPQQLLVTPEEIDAAFHAVDPALLGTLRLAADNITRFHQMQKRTGFVDAREEGVVVGQRVLPLRSVGLYVPGGTARYPSTVLMAAIPAAIAGVPGGGRTPRPHPPGTDPPPILGAARRAGSAQSSSSAARRPLRRWRTARNPCPVSIRLSAPAMCLWRPPNSCATRRGWRISIWWPGPARYW
jgi:histidinol dehydrogenase